MRLPSLAMIYIDHGSLAAIGQLCGFDVDCAVGDGLTIAWPIAKALPLNTPWKKSSQGFKSGEFWDPGTYLPQASSWCALNPLAMSLMCSTQLWYISQNL